MRFLKHIGRHSDQKVVIVFRKVPNEDHMCLVVYSEKLPRTYHDAIMKVLESKVGQDAKEFSEVLHRNLFPDGKNMLETLHREYHIKKVQTSQIIVTPNNKSAVRLDELNGLLDKIESGGEAAAKLEEMDKNRGLVSPAEKRNAAKLGSARELAPPTNGFLTDSDIANNLRQQSMSMSAQAKNLLLEAQRLLTEAEQMDPIVEVSTPAVSKSKAKATKKTTKPKKVSVAAAK